MKHSVGHDFAEDNSRSSSRGWLAKCAANNRLVLRGEVESGPTPSCIAWLPERITRSTLAAQMTRSRTGPATRT